MLRQLFTSLWIDSQEVTQQGSTVVSTGSNTSLLAGRVPWTESVFPKSTSQNPNLYISGGAFGRWWGHEGEALRNGTNALIKRLPRVPSSLSTTRGDVKKLGVSNLEEALTRTWPCWHLDLGLPASRTMRNKFTQVRGTLLTSLNSLRQGFWSTGLTHSNILGRIPQMVGQLECCERAPGRPWERTPSSRTAGQVLSSWATSLKAPRRAARGTESDGMHMVLKAHRRTTPRTCGPAPWPWARAASHRVCSCCPWTRGPCAAGGPCVPCAQRRPVGVGRGSGQAQLNLSFTYTGHFHRDFGWQAFESSKLTEEASL